MSKIIGVDIGGTNVDIGVIDEQYKVIRHEKFKTQRNDVRLMLQSICGTVSPLVKEYGCEMIGIGSPGRIPDNRTVVTAGNIAYDNTPVADIVEQSTGCRVYLDNDANCALYGEKFAGAGKDASSMIVLTIGTGVGGGIMIDRKTYHGCNNRAGELGHFIIDINGKPCNCGLHGCFEQYASVTAFVLAARKAADENRSSLLYDMAGGRLENIGGRLPFKAMYAGCALSERIIEEYIYRLSCGVNSLIKIFQPEIFVLTGGLMNEGKIITDMMKKHLLPEANVTLSPLEGKAGIIGAALIKKERDDQSLPLENV